MGLILEGDLSGSTEGKGDSESSDAGWAWMPKLLLVEGIEVLAKRFLWYDAGFLWFFFRSFTLVNPSESDFSKDV